MIGAITLTSWAREAERTRSQCLSSVIISDPSTTASAAEMLDEGAEHAGRHDGHRAGAAQGDGHVGMSGCGHRETPLFALPKLGDVFHNNRIAVIVVLLDSLGFVRCVARCVCVNIFDVVSSYVTTGPSC